MVCPRCNSKIRVVDTFQTCGNETYRRKKCDACSYAFYTIEFEVDYSEELERELYDTPRRARHRQNSPIYDEKRRRVKELYKQAFGTICSKCSDCLCDGLDTDCKKIKRWVNRQIEKESNNG